MENHPGVRVLLIIDPARQLASRADRTFTQRLTKAFFAQGWKVNWAIDIDDDLASPDCATIHRILPPSRVIESTLVSSSIFHNADNTALVNLIKQCGERDLIVIPAGEPVHLEMLMQLLPELEISSPLPTTLHMRFTSAPRIIVNPGDFDSTTIAARLSNGFPVRSLILHADTRELAQRYAQEIRLPVFTFEYDVNDCVRIPDRKLPQLLPCHHEPNRSSMAHSLVTEAHGPIAILISALWGRVGSSHVFDAQTRYLIARGYIVVRVFVDHWPHHGYGRINRLNKLIDDNFSNIRPHCHFIVERNDTKHHIAELSARADFQSASPVLRIQRLLAEPIGERMRALAWCGRRACFAVVNHLPHVAFGEYLTQAPIILETHDLYTHLLDSHGIPEFIPDGPDSHDLRAVEERAAWRRVAACVDLSPDDHEQVEKDAQYSMLVRPYVIKQEGRRRSWLQVVAENRLDPIFRKITLFDIMLWGSPHHGNARSIVWFFNEVIPLHQELYTARILIVGKVAESLSPDIVQRHNVVVAGFVDRLDECVFRAKILVIPDQTGTGISIKAMDSFAFGACFSATTIGVRGIDLGDSGYVPSKTSRELGMDIVQLLRCPTARRTRADVARRLYDLNFSEATYSQSWDAVLRRVVGSVPGESSIAAPSSALSPLSPKISVNGKFSPLPELKTPRLSVIVCTYDRYDVLPDALAALLEQDCIPGFMEILVVDNSPNQAGAVDFAAEYNDECRIRYIIEPSPGLSNARNVGVREARADLVAFVDDDAIPAPSWAREVVGAFDRYEPRPSVVGGRIVPRWVSPPPAWLPDTMFGYLSIIDWGPEMRELKPHEWLAGCNIAFDKRALMLAGGFNHALGRIGSQASLLSNEEIELIDRIRAGGNISIYVPGAVVEHVIDPDRLTREWFRRRVAWQAVSDFIKDSKKAAGYALQAGERLRGVLDSAARRVPLGLYHSTPDVECFKQDVEVTYDLVVSILSGGIEIEPTKSNFYSSPRIEVYSSVGRVRELEIKLSEMEEHLNGILFSASWRVTGPIRRLMARWPSVRRAVRLVAAPIWRFGRAIVRRKG